MARTVKKWSLTDSLRQAYTKYNENLDIAEERLVETKNAINNSVATKLALGNSANLEGLDTAEEIVASLKFAGNPRTKIELDASKKDKTKWHPFIIRLNSSQTQIGTTTPRVFNNVDIDIATTLSSSVVNGIKSSNSTHSNGGVSVTGKMIISCNSWGNLNGGITAIHYAYSYSSKPPIMMEFEGNSDELCIWCLGGWKYTFYISGKPTLSSSTILMKGYGSTYEKNLPVLSSYVGLFVGSNANLYNPISRSNATATYLTNPKTIKGETLWHAGNLANPQLSGTTSADVVDVVSRNSTTHIIYRGDMVNFIAPKTSTQGNNLWINWANTSRKFSGVIIGNNTGGGKGALYASRSENPTYADYAELFPKAKSTTTEPGDIIALDLLSDKEEYTKSSSTNRNVVGVHSDNYAMLIGGQDLLTKENQGSLEELNKENYIPVGLVGRLGVKVVGTIKKGSLIVPSDIPGVGRAYKAGKDTLENIVGMAVEPKDTLGISRIMCRLGR